MSTLSISLYIVNSQLYTYAFTHMHTHTYMYLHLLMFTLISIYTYISTHITTPTKAIVEKDTWVIDTAKGLTIIEEITPDKNIMEWQSYKTGWRHDWKHLKWSIISGWCKTLLYPSSVAKWMKSCEHYHIYFKCSEVVIDIWV